MSCIPYFFAYQAQTPDAVFNGAVFDRQDYAVYRAMMHAGKRGDWRYRFHFTSEVQQGAYVRQFYLVLGHVKGPLDVESGFQVARLLFGASAIVAIDFLAGQVFRETFKRRLAVLICVIGSGIGWLLLTVGWQHQQGFPPADFWLMEGYPFLSILTFPHFSASIATLAGVLACYISNAFDPKNWKMALGAILGLVGFSINPIGTVLAALAILGALFCTLFLESDDSDKKHARLRSQIKFILLFLLSLLPYLMYYLYVFSTDEAYQIYASQNITPSAPIIYYIFGFAGAGFLAAVGLIPGLRRVSFPEWMMLFWSFGALVIAYLPINVQSRFMLAYSIPISFLAIRGIERIWTFARNFRAFESRMNMLAILLVFFLSLSPVLLLFGTSVYVRSTPGLLFDDRAIVEAVDWLAAHSESGDVVLADQQTSQLVAARVGMIVYWGHPTETLHFEQKKEQVTAFYQGSEDGGWLLTDRIDWVLVSDGDFTPAVPGLKLAYSSDDVRIYQVLQ